MRDKDQVLIFSNAELDLLKSTFAENDELLYTIRKVLLQFELSENDIREIKRQVTPELMRLLRKKILPDIGDEFPLTQLPDLRSTLQHDLTTRVPEEMAPFFEAKQLEIDYLEQQLTRLADIDAPLVEQIRLDDLRNLKGKLPHKAFVDTTARNFILGYVDPMLIQIKSLAGLKEETLEQQKERLTRNSSK